MSSWSNKSSVRGVALLYVPPRGSGPQVRFSLPEDIQGMSRFFLSHGLSLWLFYYHLKKIFFMFFFVLGISGMSPIRVVWAKGEDASPFRSGILRGRFDGNMIFR
jgi:hypothetical protein